MTTKHQKKHVGHKSTIGSVVAEVVGVTAATVAIAGVAVATTLALKDEKTRKKVKKVLSEVKDQALDYVETLKTELDSDEAANAV